MSIKQNNSERVLKSYAQSVREEIKGMFPKSTLDNTTVINGMIFVNEAGEPNLVQAGLFKQFLEEFYKYEKDFGSFSAIDKQFKTRLYESFLRESAGISAMGQYFTPCNVVTSVMDMISIDGLKEDIKVCDPFCGGWWFFIRVIKHIKKNIKTGSNLLTERLIQNRDFRI